MAPNTSSPNLQESQTFEAFQGLTLCPLCLHLIFSPEIPPVLPLHPPPSTLHPLPPVLPLFPSSCPSSPSSCPSSPRPPPTSPSPNGILSAY
ncbi:hypothetical protein EJ06DRAFT_139856 [Trichodelitschia bisporula]|uniref:Uncharacterized protein n=1 Tax=Trichodelitschia bisporula TaxID=703511 RepID=A0A6G1HP30_9PEZI|nr:hypothetical protein EJ06DRAFT_139856 [Trichodelitschia bisporula]